MKKIMVVFGTRPEAIKMCPLVNELKSRKGIKTILCVTGQHRQMLDQVLEAFQIEPDYDLSIMKDKQTLFDITTNILNRIKDVLESAYSRTILSLAELSSTRSNEILPLSQFIASAFKMAISPVTVAGDSVPPSRDIVDFPISL